MDRWRVTAQDGLRRVDWRDTTRPKGEPAPAAGQPPGGLAATRTGRDGFPPVGAPMRATVPPPAFRPRDPAMEAAIIAADRERCRLLSYPRPAAADTYRPDGAMMRGLAMDVAADRRA